MIGHHIDCKPSLFFSSVSYVHEPALSGKATRRKKRERQPEKRKERLPTQPEPKIQPHNAKIWLVDAGNVDNKMSTIETIDKLMMADKRQECLSCFPKIDTLKAEQIKALEAVISCCDVIAILPADWFWKKPVIFQLFCEIKLTTSPNTPF